jgi:hypothetical protein
MAFCSAVTLCFASIFSLVSAALLAIAFSTDSWQVVSVRRAELKQAAEATGHEDILSGINTSPLYYTRTRGLFRECFPGEKSNIDNVPQIDLYMSPVETWCHNLNYYIPDEEGATKQFSQENMTRIHMGRSMIALFIVAFFFMFVSFITGVVGCWRTSPSNITASAILMLLACLLSAGGMGLWHGVEHYEQNKLTGDETNRELFVKGWPDILQDNTEFKYDWSYIVSWVGVGMTLGSAILFSLAAMCIKNDKEREEAMNMQYLMPVYPQKGQPYGPYGYAAYPGPAAYYGSQYGLPYSQY